MDATTKPSWLQKAQPFFTSIIEPVLGGVISKYGSVANTAVRSAITKTDNGLHHLVSVYQKWDAAHPLVQTALSEAAVLIRLTGLKVPDADALETHVRAAIHDLASAVVDVPTVDTGSTAQSSPATTAAPATNAQA